MALALVLAGFVDVPPARTGAEAQEVVGLVVSYGDGTYSYATVPLPGDGERVDGVGLLERSGLMVLAIDFGGYGQGVCKIDVTGCDVSACRIRLCQTADSDSPFWRFLFAGPAGWTMSPLGASGVDVEAGRVYGWAWAGGQGAPAEVPVLTLQEVMARSGYDAHDSPPRPAMRSTRTAGNPTSTGASFSSYAGAGIILIAVSAGGWLLVHRARRRAMAE